MVYAEGLDLLAEINEEAARCVVERRPLHWSDADTTVSELVASQPVMFLERANRGRFRPAVVGGVPING